MRRERLRLLPVLLALAALPLLAGCGGSDDDGDPAPFSATAVRFSAPSGSNANGNEFDATDGFVSQDAGRWRVFVRDTSGDRNIEVVLPTNAVGSYPVNGTTVSVVYGQEIPSTDGGTWTASSGTVVVTSLSSTDIQIQLRDVRATATAGSGNAAQGSFTMNGTLDHDPLPTP